MHYILKIFDLISRNKYAGGLSLIAITLLLLCLALRINLNEDITAFLPLNEQQQKALAVYQDTSGANKILAIFQNNAPACKDYDAILLAIEKFKDTLQQKDTAHIVHNLVTEFNTEEITQMTEFVYANIPYFLTSSDYQRIDSLLSNKDFISRQIQEDKAMLQMTMSGPVADHLAIDPLNLFQPVLARLKQHTHSKVEIYQGAIFTPDMSRAIVMMDSPFGNNETKNNTRLMNLLQSVADTVQLSTTNVNIHFIGGPSIAVENAKQIKADSTLAAVIAIALIVLLLYIHLRSTRNILLILLSVAWGSLFAIAALAVLSQRPSLIVIGISSIIIGLAVNYPLHLIAHTAHTHTQRQALREVITPLVIGNITTVGAFIALLPLQATALRDLGIFSAFLLVGTLIFTIIFLPHLIKKHAPSIPPPASEDSASDKITLPSPGTSALPTTVSNNKKIIALLLILTPIFAYYSTLTGFDADISHINYMTDQQKADIQAFQNITSNNPTNNNAIYIVAEGKTIQQALNLNQKNINNLTTSAVTSQCALTTLQFLPSKRQQQQRIQKWQAFIKKNSHKLIHQLNTISTQNGFSPDAFNQFHNILTSTYPIKEYTYFSPLTLINNPFLSIDTINKSYRVITYLHTTATVSEASASNKTISRSCDCPPPYLDTPAAWNIAQTINSTPTKPKDNTFAFHVKSLSSAATRALSDNFNYIGYACALIVFLFLTLSFQSIELALISFLPMAISWIWILGIMGIANIQFNIVNIILATFIFGQGDDYTIFITEGCTYEYAYHKKMIDSYKKSIIISATIMFIGIGTLIIAKH
ncbi:MAG: MMPL family transporter, partial [Bacteroidaceae bacterium]|nr:MMPL family transporter [Bacteroidaceae bacterium]